MACAAVPAKPRHATAASAAAAKEQPRELDKPLVHILDPLCSLCEQMELPTDRMGCGLPQLAADNGINLERIENSCSLGSHLNFPPNRAENRSTANETVEIFLSSKPELPSITAH